MTEQRFVCPKCGHEVRTVVRVTETYHACPKNRGKPVRCKEVVAQ